MKFEKRLSRKILEIGKEDTQDTEDNPHQILFG
jgi:hypothetical protein